MTKKINLPGEKPVKNLHKAFHLMQLLHSLLQMLDPTMQRVNLFSPGSDLFLHAHGHLKA